MIPDFHPIKQSVTSIQFVDKIEKLRQLHGWSDDTILFAVHHKMKGVAKLWIDALPVMETWADFKQLFLKDFPCRVSMADVHRELMARRRNNSESLVEYYYSMLAIGRRGDVDDLSILSYIINGLNDSSLTRTLQAMNLQNCNDLLRSLENLPQNCCKKLMVRGDDQVKNVSPESGTVRKGPKCFNCNAFGHISTACPQPLKKSKCTICYKICHVATHCKTKGATVAAMTEEITVNHCSPVMKDVRINGEKFLGFADTGSDFTLMRKCSVPRDAVIQPTSKRMKGFGGSVIEVTEMFTCEVVVDDESVKVFIYIIPNEVMPYDVLLGRDLLCRDDKRPTIEAGVLKVESVTSNVFNREIFYWIIRTVSQRIWKLWDVVRIRVWTFLFPHIILELASGTRLHSVKGKHYLR